jgi:hypothetical protein
MMCFPFSELPWIRKLNTQAKGGSIPLEKTESGKGKNTKAGIKAIVISKIVLVFPETG